ncbi:NAD(P)H-hydrate dehydratase [Desulfurobacterium atlanticum]|uniref:Bifunctional NAD(P)H-hydrate repair enzyme n=1 Tax=Desulfurobacterium atlanticum TaxID=240169 RepID=A0A238XKH4_9BACT|nr:NAD(P)H-hydrate dehydratase [Desulfurobacterium atlanticum]SNR59172.1 NAD(P)H-hydrate epimerase [Desulfurobacterium atlanticum]
MYVLKATEMAEIDRVTINEIGVPGAVLMENAARGLASVIFDRVKGKNALIVCGAGNNGGDGFAVARNLINHGYKVEIVLLTSPERLKGDAKINYDILLNMGVDVKVAEKETDLTVLLDSLKNADFVVDAIFGTGLTRPVEGFYATAIKFINEKSNFTVSVDIPSGLFAGESFLPEGEFIKADITVTFAYPKIAHVLPPACKMCGEVFVVDISIPESKVKNLLPHRELITVEKVAPAFPGRDMDTHKYNYGYLAVIGGSCGKTGAVSMTAMASLRTGVGLVTAIVPRDLNTIYEVKLTEPMTIPIISAEKGHFNANSLDEVITVLKESKFSTVAIGPGLGWNKDTEIFVSELLKTIKKPVVLDADGLNSISKNVDILKTLRETPILTPHTGEFSRLTGIPVKEINNRPIDTAVKFATEYGVVLVLKGARTIVATPEGKVYINTLGNPGMATAGTGDVLTGIIGALRAKGLSAELSAVAGVFVHSLSGDLAAKTLGEESLIATDLIKTLPEAIRFLKEAAEKEKSKDSFVKSFREIVGA